MNKLKAFTLGYMVLFSVSFHSQTGPGGVGATNGQGNLVSWLDASQELNFAGSTVLSWGDNSGYGNHAAPPASVNSPIFANNALNGYPVVTFDGSDDFLVSADANSLDLTRWSIIVVGKINVHKNYNSIITKGTDSQENYEFLVNHPSTGNIHFPVRYTDGTRSGYSDNDDAFSNTNFGIYELTYDQTDFRLFINGDQRHSQNDNKVPRNNTNSLFIGNEEGTTGRFLNGSIAEIIIFNRRLGEHERIILNNSLAAKYGLSLISDIYTADAAINGNFDHDVAGIGRSNDGIQNDARGTGIVRIHSPTGLGNNRYLFWGHNNEALNATQTVDVPLGVQARFEREWRLNVVNRSGSADNVGSFSMDWDLNGLGPVTASDLRLLVDLDGDGLFADEIAIAGALSLGGGIYRFSAVPGITNLDRFTLGTVNLIQTPLPVELVSFTATNKDDRQVELEWETASETNSDYFTIEKSTDAKDWEEVSSQKAAGYSVTPILYTDEDYSPAQGISYYRLKQVDFNGKIAYSDIRSVEFNLESSNELRIYPNPIQDYAEVISQDILDEEIQIIDGMGKVVTDRIEIISSGQTSLTLDFSQLNPGLYLIKHQDKTYKIIKR